MDTTKTITHLSLCAGYGGIDLGLRRVLPACRTIAYVEIEAFAIANLVSKMEAGAMDAAPVWTNLKTCDWSIFRDRVDIISGGYPCQPFSAAGNRKGSHDPRHLWPYIQGAIGIIRPRYCFFENVEGHLTLGFKDVCHDLGELGYELTAGIFSAAEVGAPHQRKRIFILAKKVGDPSGEGLQGKLPPREFNQEGREESNGRPTSTSGVRSNDELADSNEFGGEQDSRQGELRASGVEQSPRHRWPSRPGEAQQEWEEPRQGQSRGEGSEQGHEAQPIMGGATPGTASGLDPTANRVDRLRLLGNGVVPSTCEVAFRTLYKELAGE